jgi:ribosomal protein S14
MKCERCGTELDRHVWIADREAYNEHDSHMTHERERCLTIQLTAAKKRAEEAERDVQDLIDERRRDHVAHVAKLVEAERERDEWKCSVEEFSDLLIAANARAERLRAAMEYLTTGELDRPGEVADFARARLAALAQSADAPKAKPLCAFCLTRPATTNSSQRDLNRCEVCSKAHAPETSAKKPCRGCLRAVATEWLDDFGYCMVCQVIRGSRFECRECGCLWRLNTDRSWSLLDERQIAKACCDNAPDFIDKLKPSPEWTATPPLLKEGP